MGKVRGKGRGEGSKCGWAADSRQQQEQELELKLKEVESKSRSTSLDATAAATATSSIFLDSRTRWDCISCVYRTCCHFLEQSQFASASAFSILLPPPSCSCCCALSQFCRRMLPTFLSYAAPCQVAKLPVAMLWSSTVVDFLCCICLSRVSEVSSTEAETTPWAPLHFVINAHLSFFLRDTTSPFWLPLLPLLLLPFLLLCFVCLLIEETLKVKFCCRIVITQKNTSALQ